MNKLFYSQDSKSATRRNISLTHKHVDPGHFSPNFSGVDISNEDIAMN